MPKKSTKSKSKRIPLRQKYKLIRKVKEHHKKKAKELKRQAKSGALARKEKARDPGIPSQWPHKEELLKEMEFEARRQQELKAARKAERKRLAQQQLDGDAAGGRGEGAERASLAAVAADAARRQGDFDHRVAAGLAEGAAEDPDGSRRAYFREFRKVVGASDVVLQVLDARDPLACRCADVERFVRRTSPDKRVVLVLNKVDLVPREVVERWLKYLREELPTVAFKSSTQAKGEKITQRAMPASGSLSTHECLGADTLLQLLKNYARNKAGAKQSITVGVVGLPNVGKSSLINSLKRTRAVQVGGTAGVTKAAQEVVLDKQVKLLDSPGVVFSSAGDGESEAAVALRNAVKLERLEDPVTPVQEIVRRCPAQQLMQLYQIPRFDGPDEFLRLVAAARGKLKKGGVVNVPAAAKLVLTDWNGGRIPYYTKPPKRGNAEHAAAEVVSAWGRDFDAAEVFRNETSTVIAGLPTLDDADGMYAEMQASAAPTVDIDAMEAEVDVAIDDEGNAPWSSADGAGAMEAEGGEDDELPDEEYGGYDQNRVLYNAAGQYNPRAAKAAKKRARKEAAGLAPPDNDDFDWSRASVGATAKPMDEEEEEEDDDDDEEEDEDEEEEDVEDDSEEDDEDDDDDDMED